MKKQTVVSAIKSLTKKGFSVIKNGNKWFIQKHNSPFVDIVTEEENGEFNLQTRREGVEGVVNHVSPTHKYSFTEEQILKVITKKSGK